MSENNRTNKAQVCKFFDTVFGPAVDGVIAIWTKQDKKTNFFTMEQTDAMRAYIASQCNCQDTYYGVCLLRPDLATGRGKVEDVVAVPGFWVDIDIAHEAHKASHYPKSVEEALSIIQEFPLPPTIIINSGYGLHVYWLFKELWVLETDEERERAKQYSSDFQKTMQAIFKRKGYEIDNTQDLARLLRVPGTLNHKMDTAVEVKILALDESKRYNNGDLEQYFLDETLAMTVPAKPAALREGSGNFQPTYMEAILHPKGCRWMGHCKDDSQFLTEPEWHAGLTVTNCCEDADYWAHEMSKNYDGYTEEETAEKLAYIQKRDYRPVTCEYVQNKFSGYCDDCQHKVKSPIVVGRNKAILAEINSRKVIKQVIKDIESGNKSAHLKPDAVEALVLMKEYALDEFNEVRELIKGQKCNTAAFDSAIKKASKSLAGRKAKKDKQDASGERPPQTIYDYYVEQLGTTSAFLDEDGWLCMADNDGNPVKLSNFVARPVKQITRYDGMTETAFVDIEGVLAGGKKLPAIRVPLNELVAMNWPLEKWGISAIIASGASKKDRVREVTQMLGMGAEMETIFSHLGWRKVNDEWVYLHGGGAIGAENIQVDISEFAGGNYNLPTSANQLKLAVTTSLKFLELAPHRVTVPLFAIAYLTVLCQLAKQMGKEPQMIFWLFVRSGREKTSLCMVLLSHFGRFTAPPAPDKDTKNSLERKAFLAKDSLLLVDDFHPTSSPQDAAAMMAAAQYLCRLYGDRIGRGRMNADTTLRKEYPPQGLAVATGEDLLTGESSVARILMEELLVDDLDLALLTELQSQGGLLAQAMAGYIAYVRERMDSITDTIQELFPKLRQAFLGKHVHGRVSESAAWLSIGLKFALQYALKVKAIDKESAQTIYKKGKKIFGELAAKQNRMIQAERPAERFVSIFKELVRSQRARVGHIQEGTKREAYGTLIGYQDADYYYLFPEITYNLIAEFVAERKEKFNTSPSILWKRLADAGYIRVEEEQKTNGEVKVNNTVKKTLPDGSRDRVLHLKKAAISQEVDQDEVVSLQEKSR